MSDQDLEEIRKQRLAQLQSERSVRRCTLSFICFKPTFSRGAMLRLIKRPRKRNLGLKRTLKIQSCRKYLTNLLGQDVSNFITPYIY